MARRLSKTTTYIDVFNRTKKLKKFREFIIEGFEQKRSVTAEAIFT